MNFRGARGCDSGKEPQAMRWTNASLGGLFLPLLVAMASNLVDFKRIRSSSGKQSQEAWAANTASDARALAAICWAKVVGSADASVEELGVSLACKTSCRLLINNPPIPPYQEDKV